MPTPMKITLYDPKTQEAIGEYSQSIITFEMLVKASQLKELLDNPPEQERKWWWIWMPWMKRPESEEQKQVAALTELVAEFFGHQFTAEQLRKGSDVGEVVAVLRAIIARAGSINAGNPTLPPRPRPKKGR